MIEEYLKNLEYLKKYCDMIKTMPFYSNKKDEEIYAIVSTSISLNIDPIVALNGSLIFARGKIEMSARMMLMKIREKKHIVIKDEKCDERICILHGKRSDSGEEWTQSFSIEDAIKANLANTPTWKSYTKDMLFARALSRLARNLFPDVIGNTYVENEIEEAKQAEERNKEKVNEDIIEETEKKIEIITQEQHSNLLDIFSIDKEFESNVMKYLISKNLSDLSILPVFIYNIILHRYEAKNQIIDEKEDVVQEIIEENEEHFNE